MGKRPPAIERYLERNLAEPNLAVPPGGPGRTRLAQVGEMRLDPAKPWMPFTAEQTIEASKTEFRWKARFKMAPLMHGVVEDAYAGGRGRLDARLWGLVPVAKAAGPEVDRSEAQRYLAELAWCPAALRRNPELCFRELAPDRVRLWIDGEQTGDERTYVDWHFDAEGDLAEIETTTRSRGEKKGPVVQPWHGRFRDYRDFGDLRAPSRAEVWWDAPEGRFVYWKGHVTELRWES